MGYFDLSKNDFELFQDKLKEIGCVDYETWKAEKEKNGEIVTEQSVGVGMEQGDIGTAESFVNQFIFISFFNKIKNIFR